MRALYLKMTAFCTYYTNESDPKRKVVGSNSARNANLKSGDRKNGSRFFRYCMQKIVSGLQKNHPADRSREIVLTMKASIAGAIRAGFYSYSCFLQTVCARI